MTADGAVSADRDDIGPEVLAELQAGLRRPLRRGADAAPNEEPWRGPAGRALAVALPESVEEVRHAVGWARRSGIRVLAQGAVTGLVGASTPSPGGPPLVVLSTDALIQPLEIDPLAAVAVVGAGVRLSALNEAAGRHGLELPVDLAADPALGGMVATDTGGSRVMRHGTMAAHVLSLEAVLADEDVSVLAGRPGLRKDNTGAEPMRLLIGSAGALGIVTSVTVALCAVPATRATALVGPLSDEAALELLVRLRRSLGEDLSAFEVMCPAALGAALDHMADPPALHPGTDPEVTVLVEVSGDDGVADRLVGAVTAAGANDSTGAAAADRAAMVPPARGWSVRHAVTAGLRAQGTVLGFDLAVAPARLPELRRRARALVAALAPGCRVADFGHWADGGIHCNVVVPAGRVLDDATATALRDALYTMVLDDLGGSYSAEHGIGPLNASWWERTTPAPARAMLAAAKAVWDPLGVLGHPGVPFS